jgi:hypothetical protein
MNIRDDDKVSAVALVVESEADTAAKVADGGPVSVVDDTLPPAAEVADMPDDADADALDDADMDAPSDADDDAPDDAE